jgi:hypothetical protein
MRNYLQFLFICGLNKTFLDATVYPFADQAKVYLFIQPIITAFVIIKLCLPLSRHLISDFYFSSPWVIGNWPSDLVGVFFLIKKFFPVNSGPFALVISCLKILVRSVCYFNQ